VSAQTYSTRPWSGTPATSRLSSSSRNHGAERGYVKVDDALRSNLPHVFAAGTSTGSACLVPSARLEGRVAAENAVLGIRRRFTHELVPTGSFTDPEYGGVGLTEAQAREHYDCEVGGGTLRGPRAPVIDDHPLGFCKLIVERHRRYILGAHVLGVLDTHAEFEVVERPEPVPGRGQVRIEVRHCGICGSDLHARHGIDQWADMTARAGYHRFGRSGKAIVFGHEFCGEIAEHRPGCRRSSPTGTPVVALPLLRGSSGGDTTDLSVRSPAPTPSIRRSCSGVDHTRGMRAWWDTQWPVVRSGRERGPAGRIASICDSRRGSGQRQLDQSVGSAGAGSPWPDHRIALVPQRQGAPGSAGVAVLTPSAVAGPQATAADSSAPAKRLGDE
jgi:Pyridine nucleotide-disulphide oxidoreductase, dimerisation domain/Alcohol dehydrogenase GroES-like domain